MTTNAMTAWMNTGLDAWFLGLESSMVIGLRLAKMSHGGAPAANEMSLMVTEKMQSGIDLASAFATGKLGSTPIAGARGAINHYRKKVAANRRRLTR